MGNDERRPGMDESPTDDTRSGVNRREASFDDSARPYSGWGTTRRCAVRMVSLAALVLVLVTATASPGSASASTGAQKVTLDYCEPLGPETVLCEKVTILYNRVETPSGLQIQFNVLSGVVNIYHHGELVVSAYREYRSHFLMDFPVTLEQSFRAVYADLLSGTATDCFVEHRHHANGQSQFERREAANCRMWIGRQPVP